MPEYWFKRRRYGFGWAPASREGWLVLAGFLVLVVAAAVLINLVDPDEGTGPALVYVAVVAVAAAGLLAITRAKGPPPKWRWGSRPDDDPHEDI